MKEAIMKGIPQKEILDSAYKYQEEVENGERIIVGKNKFKTEEETEVKIFRVDPRVREERVEKLKEFRKNRDFSSTKEALKNLREKAKTDENLMPYILEAVKRKVTLGEIIKELKEVFGEFEIPPVL